MLKVNNLSGFGARKRNNPYFILSDASPYDWRAVPNDNLWQGVNGINNPCPPGFRVPTSDEWSNYLTEAEITDSASAWDSDLKLSCSGYRTNINGTFSGLGSSANYWTCTVAGFYAMRLLISSTVSLSSYYKGRGFTIRPIKDDSSPITAGTTIYHNGLEYIAIEAEDGNIWLDRNLGATQVATASNDPLSYGYYYQWGRGNDGHQYPDSETSTILYR